MTKRKQQYASDISQVEEIFQIMRQRVSYAEMNRIREAYLLAEEAHRNQRRKTGEPYIIHPIAVARIVAEELMLGASPVMAAFLHDVVEDTPYTIEDIKERFGEDVAFLVGAITKQKKEHYDMSKQLDNFKQILDSVRYDIRAILIKLADRLHNMRTLDSMPPDKQMKIAGETDYFYAPLANRLGLYGIKTELENLSMRYRCPQEYGTLEKMIDEDKEHDKKILASFTEKISMILNTGKIPVKIEVRYRTPYSLWQKMHRLYKDFRHLEHRHYIDIVFPEVNDRSEKDTCLMIYSLLTDTFKERPGSIANYVDNPKENGYQSFHVKLLSDYGQWEEIHICSERMKRNSKLGCVASRTEENIKRWIEKFRSVLQDIAYHGQGNTFIENVVSSFYNDDIMVFTPKGKEVILPQCATALDFAFEIHTRLGEHAKFAKINGRLCSIKTVLVRGDCVEIGTDDRISPKEDWVDHVITYKAKRFLKSYLAKQKKTDYKECRFCHPLPGNEVIGFKEHDGTVTVHKRNCPVAIRLASKFGDSIVPVDFERKQGRLYSVSISIKAVDRNRLLIDLVGCITDKGLSIKRLSTKTEDEIVDCVISFSIHTVIELNEVIQQIYRIEGVEEIQRKDLTDKCAL